MTVDELLEQIDDMIDKAWSFPLSGGKCLVEADRLRDLIDDIRGNMPSEIRQAKAIVADRADIIATAKREAEGIVRTAEERARNMVAHEEIVRQAQQKANEVLSQTQQKAREMRKGANDFSEDVLRRTEETLAILVKRRTILNVRKKGRRKLYSALADETALEPVQACFETGLAGMDEELVRYQAAKALLDQCPIPRERLAEEKAALYQQLAEVNREIRAARKQLALCQGIQNNVPQMGWDIQTMENKMKEVKRDERGRR